MPDAGDMHHDAPPPGRRLPHNIEAEMALLGAILVKPQAYDRVSDFLRPEHFALGEHRPIFDGIRRLADQGRLADVVTMKSHLENARSLDEVGGVSYLNRLVDCAVTPSNAGEYGRVIHELYVRREVIAAAEDVLNRAFAGASDIREAAEGLRSTVEQISTGSAGVTILAPGEISIVHESWLVKDLIPRTGATVVYGPSGSGKSFVALDMAMAVSRGDPWRGRDTEQGAVLYLSPDGGGLFTNRIVAYCQHHGIDLADHAVFTATCGIDLLASGEGSDTDKVLRTIEQIERKYGVSVVAVVLDTASRAMPGGDENAAKDVTRLIENLSRIGDGRRAVIAVHHSGKDLAQGMRGHSALHAAADCVLRVHDGLIETMKSRDGAGGVVGGFRLQVVEIGTDRDGDAITSCVVVETDGTRHVGNRRKMSAADYLAMKTITNLIAEHGEPLPQGTGFPTSGRHVGVSARLVSRTLRGSLFAEREAEAAQKAWERLRNKLNAACLIAANGGWIWLPDPRETDGHRHVGKSETDMETDTPRGGGKGFGGRDTQPDPCLDVRGRSGGKPPGAQNPRETAVSETDGHRHFADMSETVGNGNPDDKKPTDTDTTLRGCRMSVVGRSPTIPAADGDDDEDWTFAKENLH